MTTSRFTWRSCHKSTVLAAVVLSPLLGHAQWRTQVIQLHPGWNAVHLQVQPAPDDCDTLFSNLPVESVWKWNRRFSAIQFVADPSTLLPEDPDWRVWLPSSSRTAFLRQLRALQANQSYLVKVSEDATAFPLSIRGRVVLPGVDWFSHGLNLAGFPVHSANPPTFDDFFEFTPEVDTSLGFANNLYRLDSQGRGIRIVQPHRDRIQPGAAYWVETRRRPAHMAPLHVSAPGNTVDFGTTLYHRELVIRNAHPTDTLVAELNQRPSESPPADSGAPELAGDVPLSYLVRNETGGLEWHEFPVAGLSRALPPGGAWTLELGLRRGDLVDYQPQGTHGAGYQSILEVTDAAQSLFIPVPVTASSPELIAGASGLGGELTGLESTAGLWVGEAILGMVNAPAYTSNTVVSTPAPMPLRLIVHVDNTGQARLLQEVLLAWDPTLTAPPHTNGTYALYAGEPSLPEDASDVKRISSVGFPSMAPAMMQGGMTNQLDASVTIDFDNPTNPFLHRYHPMHDNKDWDFVAYTNAVEVPTISRQIAMAFVPNTNDTAHPIWGVDVVGGDYTETITGLRAQPIHLQGGFSLQRISQIDQLQGIAP